MTVKSPILTLFLCAETILYVSFLYCDLINCQMAGTALKYTALLLCFLFSLDSRNRRDGRTVSLALLLTALADLFLLVLDCSYAVGIAFFCPVQMLDALRLRRMAKGRPSLLPRFLLSGGALAAVGMAGCFDPVTILVCFYVPQLICNAFESLHSEPAIRNRFFSLGLWLFLCCDICVGLHNLSAYLPVCLPVPAALVQIAMWAFYLPSQVLIVLSASRRLS